MRWPFPDTMTEKTARQSLVFKLVIDFSLFIIVD